MRSRRDRHHHPQALKRAAVAALLALGAFWLPGPRADAQRIGPDGSVYAVQVEPWSGPGGPKGASTELRLVVQRRDGSVESSIVPGTDDALIDQDPAIEIDGLTGKPVLVWTRGDTGCFDIYVSRFDGATWTPIRPVVEQPGDDGKPEIRIGYYLIHVVWRQNMQLDGALVRASLDRGTLDLAYGPEILPTAIAPGAADYGTTTPPFSDSYFAAEIPGRIGGSDPGRVGVWGVRDAPVPVDYAFWVTLPNEARNVRRPLARYVRERFVVSFDTPERYYYAQRFWFGWTELRTVNLSPSVTASDARIQVEDMIRRVWF